MGNHDYGIFQSWLKISKIDERVLNHFVRLVYSKTLGLPKEIELINTFDFFDQLFNSLIFLLMVIPFWNV